MARSLSGKQQEFITAYIGEAHFNATEAARLAGYKTPHPEGLRLLRNATVRAQVDELLAAHSLTAAEVLAELSDVARAEWRDFITVKTVKGEVVDVRMDLTAKVKALELLGKAHRLFTEADRPAVSGIVIQFAPTLPLPPPEADRIAEVTVLALPEPE